MYIRSNDGVENGVRTAAIRPFQKRGVCCWLPWPETMRNLVCAKFLQGRDEVLASSSYPRYEGVFVVGDRPQSSGGARY
jgi:hypothetical protein